MSEVVPEQPSPVVAFVGVGTMGAAMATQLIRAGYTVRVYDESDAAIARQVQSGAIGCASPADAATGARFISVMVFDESQLKQVALGENGIVTAATPGTVLLVHSTVSSRVVLAVADAAAQRGLRVLDAPVTGAPARAATGELTFIVGGEQDVFEECRPLLEAMGAEVFLLGPVGAGQVGKLANNVLAIIADIALTDAVELVTGAGIAEEEFLTMVNTGTGASWISERYAQLKRSARERSVPLAERYRLRIKDTDAVLREAADRGVAMELAKVAAERLAAESGAG